MDRNLHAVQIVIIVMQSLSARRAWIEIRAQTHKVGDVLSLSARRAWIEIYGGGLSACARGCVALRKESVDRNAVTSYRCISRDGRSPQGERG